MKKVRLSLEILPTAITVGLSISILCILISSLNKGFDFSDEGYIMMGYASPHHIQPTGLYQEFLHMLLKIFSPGVIFYRSLRLILTICSSLFFAVQFIKYFQSFIIPRIRLVQKLLVYSCILLANFLSYSIFESNLSYNVLTLCVILCITGLIMKLFSQRGNVKILILSMSLLTSFQFIIKFPTAFLFAMIIISMLSLYSYSIEKSYKKYLKNMVLFLFGTLLFSGLIITITYGSIYLYFTDLITSIGFLNDHNPELLKKLYIESFTYAYEQSIYHIKTYFILFGVLTFLYTQIINFKAKKILGYLIFIITILYAWLYTIHVMEFELYKSGMRFLWRALDAYLPIILTTILLNFSLLFLHSYRRNKLINSVLFFLFLLIPISCSLGTGNEITLQCLQYMFAPLAFICMVYIIQKDPILKIINLIIIVGISILMYSQTRIGFIEHPYRIIGSLNELDVKFSNKKLQSIYTDSTANKFLNSIETTIVRNTKFENEIPVIDFCKIPGVVYAVNGYTPRNAWFSRSSYLLNNYFYSSEKTVFKSCIIFLPSNYVNNENIMLFLNKNELRLDRDFVFLDSFPHYLNTYKDYSINEKVGVWCSKNMVVQ